MNSHANTGYPDHFSRPEPHLPLRRASSQRLHFYHQGPRPLFTSQRNNVRGFNPSPVTPTPQINNVTASSEHAFAGRDERHKIPFRPPLGVQAMQRSPRKNRPPTDGANDQRSHPPSPLMMQGSQDSVHRLRPTQSVGDGLRKTRRTTSSTYSAAPSPLLSGNYSSDSVPAVNVAQGEIRESMRSAMTGQSSRVNSSSVNTEHSSFITVDSSTSDFVHVMPNWPDEESRDSFDVEDAIGLYAEGFESARNSFDDRPRSSFDHRPNTAQHLETRPHILHRRSQSASIVDRIVPPSERKSRVTTNDSTPFNHPTNTAPVARDRYGFKKASHYVSVEQFDAWDRIYVDHLNRRRKKWHNIMKSYGLTTDKPIRFPPKSDKIKRYVRKGIPPEWRGAAWFWYAGGPGMLKKHPDLYSKLLQDVSEDNIRFKPDTVSGQTATTGRASKEPEVSIVRSLRRVLQTFAVHNPSIGYCQSLNFIAGLLLLFLDEDEEKSFILLNLITSTHLPGTHGVTLEGANIDIAVLMSCIKDSLPNVWAKLDDKADAAALPPVAQTLRLPTVSLATTAWFMSLFVGTLPIECVLRTWDCLFFEGSKTLFRIALTIFKAGEKQIVAVNDPMEIFQVVQTIPRSMLDVNSLLDVCFRRRGGFGYLSQDVIERRREERRKQVKAGLAGQSSALNGWRSRWRSRTAKS
ncbi:hypothetical protein AMS68_000641 [Peltaster fructicola]|uniref:Rab-GAP TBC domain-containing protein n=1 Tax=Peltaster fructicola TaxID=286661 RepID=A0A6H0XK71_9PEZI|nr:hypothetical protein AMS68_000641 [Peltaster fructicola]